MKGSKMTQERINELAYMAEELKDIRRLGDECTYFDDIMWNAYLECFDRYRESKNDE